jgi:Protein of unknown function (DUF2865)
VRGIPAFRGVLATALASALLIAAGAFSLLWSVVMAAPMHPKSILAGPKAPAERITTLALYVPSNDWADRLNLDEQWRARRGGSAGAGGTSFGGWSPPRPQYVPPSGVTRIPRAESVVPKVGAKPEASTGAGRKTTTGTGTGVKKAAIKKAKDDDDDDDESPWTQEESRGTYRTVCVRLCDGYYWPVSFATSKDNLSRDAKVCERTCGTPARLFHHENPGQEPAEMEDARGKRYKDLKTAYLYRTNYDEACTCKPQPWDEAALARHQRFAEAAGRKKGGKKSAEAPAKSNQPATRTAQVNSAASGPDVAAATVSSEPAIGRPATPPRAVSTEAFRTDVLRPLLPPKLQALSAARRQSLAPHRLAKPSPAQRFAAPAYQSPLASGRRPQQNSAIVPLGLGRIAALPPGEAPRSEVTIGRSRGRDRVGSKPAPAPGRIFADGNGSQVR